MKEAKYPCEACVRVQSPERCDNKECAVWRRWFLQSWRQTCRLWSPEGCPKEDGEKTP